MQAIELNKQHNLTPAMLDEATAQDIAALTANQLQRLREQLTEDALILKARSDVLQAAISLRYLDKAKAQLRSNQLDTGTTHVIENELDIVVTIPKKIEWNEDGLFAELEKMETEDARHYAKLSVTIPEAKFKAAPPAIQHRLSKHRTLKPGRPKFEFKATKGRAI